MGFTWAIIRPVFSMIVFSVIFGGLAKIPSDGIPYPIFSYAALIPWTYFAAAMNMSNTKLNFWQRDFYQGLFPATHNSSNSGIFEVCGFRYCFYHFVWAYGLVWYKTNSKYSFLTNPDTNDDVDGIWDRYVVISHGHTVP